MGQPIPSLIELIKKLLFNHYLLVLLLTLPAIGPIVSSGYFPIHDNTQVVRVSQMSQALKDGNFPVRWVQDLGYGYGYPIFNFYNPLPYYLGSIVNLLGANALTATKFMFVLPIITGAIAMYLLTKKYFGDVGALISSVFYTYAPYHAVQIYVRGSVAEYWAYAVLPLVIYFLLEIKIVASGIAISILVLSHNLTAIMTINLVFLIFLIQLFKAKKKLLLTTRYALTAAIALGLSAFFWLPAALEKSFTSVDQMIREQFNTLEHFVFPRQLWDSPWGFGGSAPGAHDGLSFIIGKTHILLASVAILIVAYRLFSKKGKLGELVPFAILLFPLALFMTLPISYFIWANVPLLDFLQFPWRFLSFAALAASILAGYSVAQLYLYAKKKLTISVTALLVFAYMAVTIFVFLSSRNFFIPQFKYDTDINENNLLSEKRVKFEVSSRSDEYRPTGATQPKSFDQVPRGRYEIDLAEEESAEVLVNKAQVFKLTTNLKTSKPLVLNIYNFPGWVVYIDNKKAQHQELKPQRLIQLQIPSGNHNIAIVFKNTPVRTLANVVSGVTAIALFVLVIRKHKILS